MKLLVTIDDKDFYFNNAELTMTATDNAMSLAVRSFEPKHDDISIVVRPVESEA